MLVGGMYGIQFITIFFYFIVYTKKLANMKLFIFSLTFSICQAITILIASLTVDVNNLDIMNIIVRFVDEKNQLIAMLYGVENDEIRYTGIKNLIDKFIK